MFRIRIALSAAVTLALVLPVFKLSASSDVLLSFGSGWGYFDYGHSPGTNWYSLDYDDNSWKYGTAQFGYGDGDERTLVNFGTDAQSKFITTYFRTWFWVDYSSQYTSVTFSLLRDDGAVVYLNGRELHRSNMPDDDIDYSTLALSELTFPDQTNLDVTVLPGSLLVPGLNLVAVEIHQASPSSPDLSFDMEVVGSTGGGGLEIARGPYLQVGTSSNIVVRWRTSLSTDTRVAYGLSPDALNLGATNTEMTTEHEVVLPGLQPSTRYFYQIGASTGALAGDATYFFQTAPVPGTVRPVRFWAIGDFGTGFQAQFDVRDAYAAFTGTRYTDFWLMLGDNAYYSGRDYEYQSYVFDVYPTLLRQSVVWPTVGNHDTDQDMSLSDNFPYYQIFTMPTAGQAGGVPSGTKHYYSFDYANIHFICLDSMTTVYRQAGSPMCEWLKADIADTTRDWIVAFWHHPAYTHGTHNSDSEQALTEMRENILPILEAGGVDLALWGHSHNYERSFLIDGFYGKSGEANPTNYIDHGDGKPDGTGAYLKPAGGVGARRGTVYITDGSSGGQSTGGSLDHPAMVYSSYEAGAVVVDINGLRLDATFIRDDGVIPDFFTIDKGNSGFNLTNAAPKVRIDRADTNAVVSWPTSQFPYLLSSNATITAGGPWPFVSRPVSTNGRKNWVSVPATGSNTFFRLQRPP